MTYGILQLQKLVARRNPRISTSTETFALSSSDKLNLQQAGLHFAFTAENLWYEPLVDPKYVKFIVRLYGYENDIDYVRGLNYHRCTKEELDKFPAPESTETLSEFYDDRVLYCIDLDKYGD